MMTEDDLGEVLFIERSVFKRPWTWEFFKLVISDIRNYVVTIRNENDLLGYGGYHLLRDNPGFLRTREHYHTIAHLISIAEAPRFQHRGYGRILMNVLMKDAMLKQAGYCYLEVRPSNTNAFSFYKRQCFSIIGIIDNYYAQEHEDAYVLGRELRPRIERC